jgi:2-oxopent-4-enoate/cis-2-oxohex-4-enoate hydratase
VFDNQAEISMMENDDIKRCWFAGLAKAYEEKRPVDSLESRCGELAIEEAYDVQSMLIGKKIDEGERIIGWKVGATSRHVMDQLGIREPILGCMTSGSCCSATREVKGSHFCKLAVEGEIAFVMSRPLKGTCVTKADVLSAVKGVMGAVELVDCRIEDWKTSTAEAVADNALHGGVILGPLMKSLNGMDPRHEGVILWKNGGLLASACGVEALGDPVDVVVWVAHKLTELGRELQSGEIILTGSLTKFFFVEPGDVMNVSFSSLGHIQFSVTD